MNAQSPSHTDELTGLLSHKAFQPIFDAALDKIKGSETPLCLAFIDIDHFAVINETYGHSGGDEVLLAVAEVLRALSPEGATISRYGGDEFVILFPGMEREQAFLLVERMRVAVSGKTIPAQQASDPVKPFSISAGISCAPLDGRLKSELMRKANQALYRAKVTGRGKVLLATDERMVPKTSHYTQTQLERLSNLAVERQAGEAELLREALDDLIAKYREIRSNAEVQF